MRGNKILLVMGNPRKESIGMVYGTASEAGEIRNNRDLMEKAYELGE